MAGRGHPGTAGDMAARFGGSRERVEGDRHSHSMPTGRCRNLFGSSGKLRTFSGRMKRGGLDSACSRFTGSLDRPNRNPQLSSSAEGLEA